MWVSQRRVFTTDLSNLEWTVAIRLHWRHKHMARHWREREKLLNRWH
jgi:hypothetical protein